MVKKRRSTTGCPHLKKKNNKNNNRKVCQKLQGKFAKHCKKKLPETNSVQLYQKKAFDKAKMIKNDLFGNKNCQDEKVLRQVHNQCQ